MPRLEKSYLPSPSPNTILENIEGIFVGFICYR